MDTFLKASADTFIKNPTKEMAESVIMLTAAILTSLKTQDETTAPHKDETTAPHKDETTAPHKDETTAPHKDETIEPREQHDGGGRATMKSKWRPLLENSMFVKDLDEIYIREKYEQFNEIDTFYGYGTLGNPTLFSPKNVPIVIWKNKKHYDNTDDDDREFVLNCLEKRELFHAHTTRKMYKLWRFATLHAENGCVALATLRANGFERDEIDELTSLHRVGRQRYEDSGKFRVAKHLEKKDGLYHWIALESEFW